MRTDANEPVIVYNPVTKEFTGKAYKDIEDPYHYKRLELSLNQRQINIYCDNSTLSLQSTTGGFEARLDLNTMTGGYQNEAKYLFVPVWVSPL
ncbi:hypothetical protein HYALB_00000253 [Hymenoscyphus albidus]|uniref:Uncharacterized protein n=1 Tax=Hymenoscyphus albidus TaxID=595503 RepID=A0A9N9LU21_9HELO|nr:hypothetical protein HYALB_00000253 [Hymenoscyphus albidus]